MREPIWSKRELAILKDFYESGVPLPAIAAYLKRSPSAIRTRAQMHRFCRPSRVGFFGIAALQKQAIDCRFDATHIPTNPTALKILIWLLNTDIASKRDLDQTCSIGASARNKAIQLLDSLGLVLSDKYWSPSEIILTRRAYQLRPEPSFVDPAAVHAGILPTMRQLTEALDTWTAASCRNAASVDRYRDFIVRQLINVESGDIPHSAFYSIFFDLEKINVENADASGTDHVSLTA